MSEYKDKRKNVYIVTAVSTRSGQIELIESYSNKKRAEERFQTVHNSFVKKHEGTKYQDYFRVELTHTKLTRR